MPTRIMTSLKFKIPQLMREFLAEFISTFILLCFGMGSVAQKVLSRGELGTTLSINFSWGMGVTFGVYWAGGISGAHMNPAVTLANAVVRRFPWKKLPVYVAAQLLGAFIASAVVYGVYYDALNAFDGGTRQVIGINATAGIWATYPQPYLSHLGGFFDQLFGTALLVGCIFAVVDGNNNAVEKGMAPLIIGFIVFVIGMTFGMNCGYAINPARDLGPRMFTAIAGWGSAVFSAYDYWFYVPLLGELIGGPLGAITYILLIELHHGNDECGSAARDVETQSREETPARDTCQVCQVQINSSLRREEKQTERMDEVGRQEQQVSKTSGLKAKLRKLSSNAMNYENLGQSETTQL